MPKLSLNSSSSKHSSPSPKKQQIFHNSLDKLVDRKILTRAFLYILLIYPSNRFKMLLARHLISLMLFQSYCSVSFNYPLFNTSQIGKINGDTINISVILIFII
jgi:hypothetical protein